MIYTDRLLHLLGELYLGSKQPCKAVEYFLESVTCSYSHHLLDCMILSMIGLARAQVINILFTDIFFFIFLFQLQHLFYIYEMYGRRLVSVA